MREGAAESGWLVHKPLTIIHGDKTTVSAQIAALIRHTITAGTLHPGDRIPSERDLALQLGVARSAVREALHELRAQGFLESGKGRQGTVVASLADTSLNEPLAQLLQEGTSQFVDLIELRMGLEVQAAALAARRRLPEDLAELERILRAMAKHIEKSKSAQLDAGFHGAVAQATHNLFYVHVTAHLVSLLQENIPAILDILYTHPSSSQDLLAQHTTIVAAISRRDEAAARKAMTDHLGYVVDGIGRLGEVVDPRHAPPESDPPTDGSGPMPGEAP
jgi:GntR family transcriptional repressor for pyruvate dehydrogenase complex